MCANSVLVIVLALHVPNVEKFSVKHSLLELNLTSGSSQLKSVEDIDI